MQIVKSILRCSSPLPIEWQRLLTVSKSFGNNISIFFQNFLHLTPLVKTHIKFYLFICYICNVSFISFEEVYLHLCSLLLNHCYQFSVCIVQWVESKVNYGFEEFGLLKQYCQAWDFRYFRDEYWIYDMLQEMKQRYENKGPLWLDFPKLEEWNSNVWHADLCIYMQHKFCNKVRKRGWV